MRTVVAVLGALLLVALLAIVTLLGLPARSDEPSPWVYVGDSTWKATFDLPLPMGGTVSLFCIKVEMPRGFAKGLPVVACGR